MLINLLFCDGTDYVRSLKHRRLAAGALLCVGILGLICYFLLVPKSTLSDYAQGFYLGAASGITAGAAILLVRVQYLLTHPAAQKKDKIEQTDERRRQIVNTAFRWAGMSVFFAAVAALFVLLPLYVEAFWALFGMVVLYAVAFVVANLILERRM